MKSYKGHEIPGMIEPIEQKTLEELAMGVNFDSGESVVEFGTFFGRSTACLSAGLRVNPSFTSGCTFYAYDSFECGKGGFLYPQVIKLAQKHGLENLLEKTDRGINFLPVFESFLRKEILDGLLLPQKAELTESHHKGGRIKLLHIDSPKFYKEFKIILFRFFAYLKEGGVVVFQDFFYHWSASVVAVCGLLIERGFLMPTKTAASSLVCMVNKEIDLHDIAEIDLAMDFANIPVLIDFALQSVKKIEIDREEAFMPRLVLAKIQWLFESGNHAQATSEFIKFFNTGGRLNNAITNDFLEVMNHGFSIRWMYEKDRRF